MIFEIIKQWSPSQQKEFFSRFSAQLEDISVPNLHNPLAENSELCTGKFIF